MPFSDVFVLYHVGGVGAGSNQLVLGGDVGVTPIIGRHGTADLHIGKRTGIALGWAASKGWYAGAAAQAGIIRTRGDVNKKFYGKEVRSRSTRPTHIPHPVVYMHKRGSGRISLTRRVFLCCLIV